MDANLLSLPKHWAIKTLVELTVQKNISYGIVQPGKHENDGIPIIRVNNFNSSGLDVSNVMKVAPKIANKSLKTSLKKNDLLLTLVGSTGLTYIVPKKYEGWNVARAVAVIRTDDTVSADWIKICLDSTFTKYFLDSRANTTVQKTLNLSDVKQVPIPIPLAHERAFIEKNIGNLNKKIELNQKTNQTLEKMAQALFKSWFVDFDPVFDNLLASVDFNLDNLEGSLPNELKQKAQRRLVALNSLENVEQYKASLSALAHELQAPLSTKEATQAAVQVSEKAAETPVKANFNANPNILAQHANTHFPNEFEHNEQLGWIPKGWERKSFKEVIDKYIDNRGKTPPLVNNGIPLIEVKHIPESSNFPSFKSEKQFSLETYNTWFRAHVEERDILISTVGTIGRTAYVKDTKFGIAQNILGLRFGKHVNPEYMFYYIKSHRFQYDMDARLITTVQASIKRKDLDTITILVPDGQIQNSFSEIINSILTQQFSKKLESEQLTKLRDTLLPKLISGELQIPDVATDEEIVD
jgi:type I restriction enzyme S subunit